MKFVPCAGFRGGEALRDRLKTMAARVLSPKIVLNNQTENWANGVKSISG